MKKELAILFCLLFIGLSVNGQNLEKLNNGVVIKGNQYLNKEYDIEFKTFTMDSVSVEIVQVFRKESKGYDFNCSAIIQSKRKDRIIDELYFEHIEPVGSSYGICFSDKQPNSKFIVGSKYGDYSGQIIIIDDKGTIIKEPGGNYFTSESNGFIISDWHSDLSGLTIFDFEEGKICYSKELPVHLSEWYENGGTYYAAEWKENREADNIYEFNPDNLSLVKTDLNLDELHQFKKVNMAGCKPN